MFTEEIIKEAMTPSIVGFLSKFIKPTETAKMLGKARKVYKAKGFQPAVKEVAKHKSILHNIEKGKWYYDVPEAQSKGTALGRFFRTGAGNVASNIETLTKGVGSSGKKAPITVVKNLGELIRKNVRSSTLTTIPYKKSPLITKKKGKTYVGKYFKKKVVGVSPSKREYIVERTLPGKAFGVAMSAPAWGAYEFMGHKEEKLPKRLGRAAAETAMWTAAPTLALGASFLPKRVKHKRTKIKEVRRT